MLADPGAAWAHRGAILAHLGARLADLGAIYGGKVGRSWGYAHLGATLAHLGGHVGPSRGLCWPILTPMLTDLEPQDPTNEKKGEEHETP